MLELKFDHVGYEEHYPSLSAPSTYHRRQGRKSGKAYWDTSLAFPMRGDLAATTSPSGMYVRVSVVEWGESSLDYARHTDLPEDASDELVLATLRRMTAAHATWRLDEFERKLLAAGTIGTQESVPSRRKAGQSSDGVPQGLEDLQAALEAAYASRRKVGP